MGHRSGRHCCGGMSSHRGQSARGRMIRLLSLVGIAGGLVVLTCGTAFAYWQASDSSNAAAALAATLAAPTGGAQDGTATPSAIPVSWTAPAGYTPTGYIVHRCTGSACTPSSSPAVGGCSNVITSVVTATSCTDSDPALAPDTTYTYEVEAVLDNWVSAPGSTFTGATTAVSKLTFTTQPSSGQDIQATGTGSFSVSVAIQDSGGGTDVNDNSDAVTLAIGTNPAGGVLTCTNSGGLTVTASAGVAHFTGCAITLGGTGYELTATAGSLTPPANANAFNIIWGFPSKLAFTTQPTSGQNIQATGTGSFSVTAVVQDQNGNTVRSDIGRPITLATGTNPSGGVLSCTNAGGLTVTDASGVADFTGCAITLAGVGYELTASSSPPLPAPANANAFNIIAGAPAYLGFTSITVPVTGATTANCTPNSAAHTNACTLNNPVAILSYTAKVTLLDQNGNQAPAGSSVTVSLSSSALSSVSPGSLTIASGSSTSSGTFTESLGLGAGTATASATVSSVTFQSAITAGL